MNQRPVITLTTDFGLADEFIACMKGVILSIAPETTIVDISHLVGPGNIKEGAFLLHRAYPFFPSGTVHCTVIDPGVGTKRNIIAIKSAGQLFVAPDNGLLSPLLHDIDKIESIYTVTNKSLFLKEISDTFHGRDIMAPVAAHLATGLDIHEVGVKITRDDCILLPQHHCRIQADKVVGEVIHIDRFGNLCTNITASDIANLLTHEIMITIGNHRVVGIMKSYGAVKEGELLAHLDSHNHLEISVSGSSAATFTDSQPGTIVTVLKT